MKVLQILIEVGIFALSVMEIMFGIQMTQAVKVPSKIFLVMAGIIVLIIVLISLELTEASKNRAKRKKMQADHEQEIKKLKDEYEEKIRVLQNPPVPEKEDSAERQSNWVKVDQ